MHLRIKPSEMPLLNAVKCVCSDDILCFLGASSSCNLFIHTVRMRITKKVNFKVTEMHEIEP
jgi:hypothetical protein